MKNLKKILAVLLAVMMLAALSVTALATANTGSSDFNGSTGHPYAQQSSNTFSIKKEIVLFNVDSSSIFDPNVVYTYTVAPVDVTDGDVTVTGIILNDANDPHQTTTAVVKDGIAGAVTIQGRKVDQYVDTTASADHAVTGASGATTTITFGGDNGTKTATLDEGTTVTTSNAGGSNGKVALGYIDVTVNADTIYAANKGPGIYRYKISDTTAAATLTAAGIERQSGYVTDLYLDVYVKNNTNDPVDGYVVYGYVLFKEGASAGANADADILYASGTSESLKVDGYTVLSEIENVDQYHTYNVEVTKTTTGDLADKRNNFPFEVTLSNAVVSSQDDFYYVVTTDGTPAAASTTKLAADGSWSLGDATTAPNNSVLKFQDGDGILITGLPVSTKITVKEYNNTFDTYTASAKDEAAATLKLSNNAATPTTNADSVALDTTKAAFLYAQKDIDYTDSKDIVAFTNTMDVVSPTGVVMRFAPFAIILAAGCMLLLVARKRREAED